MIRTRSLLILFIAGLVSACASTDDPLANAGDDHAVFFVLTQKDVDETHFPARLARIDERAVSHGQRRTFRLPTGKHTLAFTLDLEALARYEPKSMRAAPKPSPMAAETDERSIEVVIEPGKTYKFGALVTDYDYRGWKPYVEEIE